MRIRRRSLLWGIALLPFASQLGFAAARSRSRPGAKTWPSQLQWDALMADTGGRLQPVAIPAPDAKLLANQFYLRDQPGLTQISGWVEAWQSAPSAYALKARDAADVAKAITFAQRHDLRLVVKGGGHSYVGGSNAPDSLLIWTRGMDAITLHDGFVPQGSSAAPAPAVSLGAGCVWGEVYDRVVRQAGRYVQGGGCATVGVAGLIQGGGFGSFSKAYGVAAASLLEAEIVTADGVVRVVNAGREPDLFWAIKGGGGGTFGVVTRLTLKTHALPQNFGAIRLTVQASSDDAFRRLLDRFLRDYRALMFDDHWGEQVKATPDRRLIVELMFQDLDEATARRAWQGLADFVAADPVYRVTQPLRVIVIPARNYWDADYMGTQYPDSVVRDSRPGAPPANFWWRGDGAQAGIFWHRLDSLWLPAALLEDDKRPALVDAWFAASRHWEMAFHFNKGLAGADAATLAASRETSINPKALGAFALAIIGAGMGSLFDGLAKPDMTVARSNAQKVKLSMDSLRVVAPDGGSYLSECDYFIADWRSAWGENWQRLDRIKRRYDPRGLFIIHHGIGSQDWSRDGFTSV